MGITPDCIGCIYKASLAAIRELTSDEVLIKDVVSKVLQLPAMRGLDWSPTSPRVFETVMQRIYDALGDNNPFEPLKNKQNQKGSELFPWMKRLVDESKDKLYTAAKLAIIGNSLDLLWSEGSVDVEPIIESKLRLPLNEDNYVAFKNRVKKSKLIVYLGDNAGEIYFDKLHIETIRSMTDAEIIFVVRRVPVMNDATYAEAEYCGMDKIAKVIDNGIEGPFPGTDISRCSQELQTLLKQADLVISKGGGNHESLDEYKHLLNNICFMLMCKCLPQQQWFNTKLYDPILQVCFDS